MEIPTLYVLKINMRLGETVCYAPVKVVWATLMVYFALFVA